MKKGVFTFVVGLLAYVRSVPTGSETVWLKDMTTRFQTDKRKISDIDLPDQLTFHLTRGLDVLTLNLKRNYDIDPNADIYVVQKLKDGGSFLAKTRKLEKEAVAYYQDRENGAFMTVRCVKRSNDQCDRVINGNIGIGDSSYDLRPEEADVASRNLSEVPRLLGKRYLLLDQSNIQKQNSFENKDAESTKEQNVEQELRAFLRRFRHGQDKQNNFARADATLSSQNGAGLHNRGATDKTRQKKHDYYVEVAVLIDSGIWDLYSSRVQTAIPQNKTDEVKRKIREAYSHVMNGVNLRYKEIEDTSMSISVTLAAFIFFQHDAMFPHKQSSVTIVNGTKCINVYHYLTDLHDWDKEVGVNHLPEFDHAMLFTRHDLYGSSPTKGTIGGRTYRSGVCVTGRKTSVIRAFDYARTVSIATHELGHNLGAYHDGEGDSKACKAEDFFIMTPLVPQFSKTMPYSRNPWMFSNCSVQAFKKILKDKLCLTNIGMFYNMDEWTAYMQNQLGDVFTPNEQCYLVYGANSVYCGTKPKNICHKLTCTDPKTGKCRKKYYSAARGTICGHNMWCIEGRCVSKRSSEANDVCKN